MCVGHCVTSRERGTVQLLLTTLPCFPISQVAGASMAELMATFCDNLLKKVRAGRRPSTHVLD